VLVERRKGAKKVTYRGIYTGARVGRGIDWQWDNQNVNNLKGKVAEIRDWNESSFQSGVYVVWDDGSRNLYRLGYNGMVCVFLLFEKYFFFFWLMEHATFNNNYI
jgi:E3 ubiquitin-protein ligase mind-bomb